MDSGVVLQGMNFLAGLLLTWLDGEAESFGALVVLMQERNLRALYKTDLVMLQVRTELHVTHLMRAPKAWTCRRWAMCNAQSLSAQC
jgi:Rab-GTPase-TBC domain